MLTIRRDYRDLVPLLRHRHEPDHPAVAALRRQANDVRLTVDAGFQLRVSSIVASYAKKFEKNDGRIDWRKPAQKIQNFVRALIPYPCAFTFLGGKQRVVIWSAEAVKSEWVQSEADTARTQHKLVQLTVDGSRLRRGLSIRSRPSLYGPRQQRTARSAARHSLGGRL